ncbi:hypothetical protein I79_015871 [Cricetulus griseus]|uniref:Uncharacterized protein n=1 Tax=Cricetulus griseus TaxID=10029 RepID=G3HXV6_CRIGR|nr:hypothetical protein I79_015871 [Cricetulus griseus]
MTTNEPVQKEEHKRTGDCNDRQSQDLLKSTLARPSPNNTEFLGPLEVTGQPSIITLPSLR